MTADLLKLLLTPELREFIKRHEHDDEKELILKQSTIHGVPSSLVAEQIVGRRKAKNKLPSYYGNDEIIYSPRVNLEQCSSEATAEFKAGLVQGKKFADLTGGFGIDTFSLAKKFDHGTYVDPNNHLLNIAKHNHDILGDGNIAYFNTAAENFLETSGDQFDLIFIDPSRRADSNKKVFKLSACVPNVIDLWWRIFEHTPLLLLKTSPLLDLQQGLKELKFVEKIFVVSVDNECKEVLFLCRKDFEGEPTVEAINIIKSDRIDSFSFLLSQENIAEITNADPLHYLYEPNASILKAGAFKSIGLENNLFKLHPSTHFYTSDLLLKNFPGRVFEIEAFIKPDPKIMLHHFPDGRGNVTTRNYPLTPEQLKKKTGLKEGGEKFLIGFSGVDKKFLVVAQRLR